MLRLIVRKDSADDYQESNIEVSAIYGVDDLGREWVVEPGFMVVDGVRREWGEDESVELLVDCGEEN
jgi:hypothetical protein